MRPGLVPCRALVFSFFLQPAGQGGSGELPCGLAAVATRCGFCGCGAGAPQNTVCHIGRRAPEDARDKVLKLFSNLMHEACRDSDYTARMGGDEFVIIAPSMPSSLVAERAMIFSSLAQRAGREICGKDFLSLSLGAAFFPHDGVDSEQLLAEADRKMYAAKQRHYQELKAVGPKVARAGQMATVH